MSGITSVARGSWWKDIPVCGFLKDTHKEKTLSNKSPAPKKSTNMGAYLFIYFV